MMPTDANYSHRTSAKTVMVERSDGGGGNRTRVGCQPKHVVLQGRRRGLIPVDRFADLLLGYAQRNAPPEVLVRRAGGQNEDTRQQVGVKGWLAFQTGLTTRRVQVILNGGEEKQWYVTLRLADRVLCRLGLNYLWHIPAEQGGFADLYEGAA